MKRIGQIGLIGLIALAAGCATVNEDGTGFTTFGKILDWAKVWHGSEAELIEPSALDPESVELAGEWKPDPRVVLYRFVFADGTKLIFREHHEGDYWGDYPSAGWGQITWPDGTVEAVDVNRLVRHGGMYAPNEPVTTAQHGKRYYWMADAEEKKDVKRVTIFADGWHPHVESAVLATQIELGIDAQLIECEVEIEK